MKRIFAMVAVVALLSVAGCVAIDQSPATATGERPSVTEESPAGKTTTPATPVRTRVETDPLTIGPAEPICRHTMDEKHWPAGSKEVETYNATIRGPEEAADFAKEVAGAEGLENYDGHTIEWLGDQTNVTRRYGTTRWYVVGADTGGGTVVVPRGDGTVTVLLYEVEYC